MMIRMNVKETCAFHAFRPGHTICLQDKIVTIVTINDNDLVVKDGGDGNVYTIVQPWPFTTMKDD